MYDKQKNPRKLTAANVTNRDRRHKSLARFFVSAFIGLFALTALSACQTSTPNRATTTIARPAEFTPLSDSLSSNYLMARHAVYGNDLPAATDFFTATLRQDNSDLAILRHSFLTHYQSGNIEQAAEIARRMEALNVTMPLASEPALIEAAITDDWAAVAALSDILSQSDTSLIIGGVSRSWALLAQGQFAGAVGQMSQTADLLKDELGLTPIFMELQIAYLLEAAGKTEEALNHLANLRRFQLYPPHIQLSIAGATHRLGAAEKADKLIRTHLSPSFDVAAVRASFANGTSPLLRPMTIRRGLSQALLDTSWLDTEKSVRSLLLARAHLSLIIAPDFDAAHFVVAQEYLSLDQLKPAMRHVSALRDNSPYFLPAQLMLISFKRRTDDHDGALALARDLREKRPNNARLLLVESDILRSIGRCAEAVPLYKALLNSDFDTARLHRNLAICLEQSATTKAQEDEAESYFLSSLARDPNDAFTLNYLGYWYADTNRNLDKAIAYIQKAVEIQPSSGFFVDSLGWVYYRLKAYDRAVELLEQAIQLEPLDAVITEHLGDAYWRVGRHFEAIYKWQLAYAQSNEAEMSTRLQEKLRAAQTDDGEPLVYEAQ